MKSFVLEFRGIEKNGGLPLFRMSIMIPKFGISRSFLTSAVNSAICCINSRINLFYSAVEGWTIETLVKLTSPFLSPIDVFPFSRRM